MKHQAPGQRKSATSLPQISKKALVTVIVLSMITAGAAATAQWAGTLHSFVKPMAVKPAVVVPVSPTVPPPGSPTKEYIYVGGRLVATEETVAPPVLQTPYPTTAHALPGIVQAEDFDNGGEGIAYHDTDSSTNVMGAYRSSPSGVDIETCGDVGSGYNVGYTWAGEWLEYTVNVATTGRYAVEARVAYAMAGAGGTFHVEFDDSDKTGTLAIPTTGGWQTYQTVRKSGITLNAGQHVMRLKMDTAAAGGGSGNFNYLQVSSDAPPTVSIIAPAGGSTFTPPANLLIEAAASDGGGSISKVEFFTGATKLGEDTTAPYSYAWSNVSSGTYALTAKATDDGGATTISTASSVTVKPPNAAPTISLTAPANSAVYLDVADQATLLCRTVRLPVVQGRDALSHRGRAGALDTRPSG